MCRGKVAFLACCDVIQNKFVTTPKSLSLQALKPLSGSSFLMDNEIEKEHRTWMAVAVENFSANNEVEEVEEAEVPEVVPGSPAVLTPLLSELETASSFF